MTNPMDFLNEIMVPETGETRLENIRNGLALLTLDSELNSMTLSCKELFHIFALLDRYHTTLTTIGAETIYTYDDGNEGPYIKVRARELAREAVGEV
jgi:hypothetical protein